MEVNQHAQPLAAEFVGPRLLCMACGYDLRGLAAGGKCPECGRPVASSVTETTHRVFKPQSPVEAAQGTTCVRCGADLSGCSSHIVCSDCGTPVWLSLDGDWLCVRHPAWLRRLGRGVSIWIWATVVSLVAKLSLLAIALAGPRVSEVLERSGRISAEQFLGAVGNVQDTLGLMSRLLDWSAVVLITGPCLGFAMESRYALRRCIRMLLPIGVACGLLSWSFSALSSDTHEEEMLVLRFLSFIANMFLFVGTIAYTRSLCSTVAGSAACSWSCSGPVGVCRDVGPRPLLVPGRFHGRGPCTSRAYPRHVACVFYDLGRG